VEKTNLRLYEMTVGSVSLFPACYLQGMPQLQRVEPSARDGAAFEQDALSARETP
jgi:hypothetical protein